MGCLLKHPIFLAFEKGARVHAPLLLVRTLGLYGSYVVAGLQTRLMIALSRRSARMSCRASGSTPRKSSFAQRRGTLRSVAFLLSLALAALTVGTVRTCGRSAAPYPVRGCGSLDPPARAGSRCVLFRIHA